MGEQTTTISFGLSREARRKRRKLQLLAALAAGVAVSAGLSCAGQAGAQAVQATQAKQAPDRGFEFSIRGDFFAGLAGDPLAMERGMKACDDALARNPKDAQALAWQGGGLFFRSKESFLAGDRAKGMEMRDRGLKQMEDAVALTPDNVAVLIPRAAILLSAAQHIPDAARARQYYQTAMGDYEKVLQLQAAEFPSLSVHARGELLGGLAEGWHGLGDPEKSRQYLHRMAKELEGTVYERKAAEVLSKSETAGPLGVTCQGCHLGSSRKE
jgi:tetratricopeptide (TPR) repeat protein